MNKKDDFLARVDAELELADANMNRNINRIEFCINEFVELFWKYYYILFNKDSQWRKINPNLELESLPQEKINNFKKLIKDEIMEYLTNMRKGVLASGEERRIGVLDHRYKEIIYYGERDPYDIAGDLTGLAQPDTTPKWFFELRWIDFSQKDLENWAKLEKKLLDNIWNEDVKDITVQDLIEALSQQPENLE